jgi:anion-transporting  ArsA/GET3 family ATPase
MTEFIIATIPTYLGVNESARLLQSLRKEGIPCKRIVVNQVGRAEGRVLTTTHSSDERHSRQLHRVGRPTRSSSNCSLGTLLCNRQVQGRHREQVVICALKCHSCGSSTCR